MQATTTSRSLTAWVVSMRAGGESRQAAAGRATTRKRPALKFFSRAGDGSRLSFENETLHRMVSLRLTGHDHAIVALSKPPPSIAVDGIREVTHRAVSKQNIESPRMGAAKSERFPERGKVGGDFAIMVLPRDELGHAHRGR